MNNYRSINQLGNKYKNEKIKADGHTFDSKKEYRRYLQLKEMQTNDEISGLQLQRKFVLIPSIYEESKEVYKRGAKKGQPKQGKLLEKECAYYADFTYYKNGELIVEDTKSKATMTPQYVIKRKLMRYVFGIGITEV